MRASEVCAYLKYNNIDLVLPGGLLPVYRNYNRPRNPDHARYVQYGSRLNNKIHYEIFCREADGTVLEFFLDDERGAHCVDELRQKLYELATNPPFRKNQMNRKIFRIVLGETVDCRDKDIDKIKVEISEKIQSLYNVFEKVLTQADAGEDLMVGDKLPVLHKMVEGQADGRLQEGTEPEWFVDNVLAPVDDPFRDGRKAAVVTVEQLLRMKLRIPEYQRPYKWARRNVEELLQDIKDSLDRLEPDSLDAKPLTYRLGTVILNSRGEGGCLDVVDGQQRILTLLLINRLLNGIRKNKVNCPIMEDDLTLQVLSRSKITRKNLHDNSAVVRSYLAKDHELRRKLISAFASTLEVVVVKVDELPEAFQLFDSQNTRGRTLDPHDLLKAFHLRAMTLKAKESGKDNEAEMLQVVTKWEAQNQNTLRELFDEWLFRIGNWGMKRRTHKFEAKDIHVFKGVPFNSSYSFALRAKAAMPQDDGDACRRFQIGDDFEEGREFFRMTEHYLQMVAAAKGEQFYEKLDEIKKVLGCADGRGFAHAEKMFRCALVAYADRFGEAALTNDPRVIRKLCAWAFTLRLDMGHVSEDSINKYAVIESGSDYTNTVPMFSVIKAARNPSDIAIVDVCGTSKRMQGVKGREALVMAIKELEA